MNAITQITADTITACKGCGGAVDVEVGAFCSADCLTLHYLNADFLNVAAIWPPAGTSICESCDGKGTGPSEWHYVREQGIRNACGTCDGRGHTKPLPHTQETTQ